MSGVGVEVSRAAVAASAERGDSPVSVSVIVPVIERPESLTDLYREFSAPLRAAGRSFEFLFACELTSNVANRSSDGLSQLFRQQS